MEEKDQIARLVASIALQHDQAAYKQLFLLLHKRLKQFCYGMLKSQEEAEETVSDLFIGIWQKRDQLLAIESPLLYFYTTAKNLSINRLNKLKRQQTLSLNDWPTHYNNIHFDPEQLMITKEMSIEIRQAINSLPPRCHLIFKLIKEDGLKYREVAELLNLSVKTVEAQMAIALRRLGKCMQLELNSDIPAKFP